LRRREAPGGDPVTGRATRGRSPPSDDLRGAPVRPPFPPRPLLCTEDDVVDALFLGDLDDDAPRVA